MYVYMMYIYICPMVCMCPYPLLQQRSADGNPLLQILDLSFVLRVGVDLDFALVGVQQLQLLLQLHAQDLILRLLGFIQSQLSEQTGKSI